jgi:hypothetical protein
MSMIGSFVDFKIQNGHFADAATDEPLATPISVVHEVFQCTLGAGGAEKCWRLRCRLDGAVHVSLLGIGHCLAVMVMTIGIAMGLARVMARRAFHRYGRKGGDADGGEPRASEDGHQIGAPRRRSDGGRFPFASNRAGEGTFVRMDVERT